MDFCRLFIQLLSIRYWYYVLTNSKGNSPHLSFGPEAFTSVLLGQSLISEEKLGELDVLNTASVLTFMSGLFCILVGAFRGGFIENVLSGYLLVGFNYLVSNLYQALSLELQRW
jgi:MFS superfamily sulfate permease-like transporter